LEIKYKGETITVSDDFVMKMGQHAASRGMTLEEYIVEAFTMINNSDSCGTPPAGWIPLQPDIEE